MLPLAISGSDTFALHNTGYGHPERVQRYWAVAEALKSHNLWRADNTLAQRSASIEEVALCHDNDYITLVERECSRLADGTLAILSTGDVVICKDSYDIALAAVGAALQGVDAIMEGFAASVFCPTRPPGHHA